MSPLDVYRATSARDLNGVVRLGRIDFDFRNVATPSGSRQSVALMGKILE